MNKRKKLIIFLTLAILLTVSSIGGYMLWKSLNTPSDTYSRKIFNDNKTFADTIYYGLETRLEVLNSERKIVDTIVLEKNNDIKEIVLKNAKDSETLLFDHWEIEKHVEKSDKFYLRDKFYYKAIPKYVNKADYVLTFTVGENAKLEQGSYIRKPYTNKTKLEDYLPEVLLKENYNGKWTIEDNPITAETVVNQDLNIHFSTFQDKNANAIDDFTEKFTIKFIPNQEGSTIPDKIVGWEETIELPKLKEEATRVFYDWYTDKEFKNLFTEEMQVTKDLTLYAKFKTYEEIINTTIDEPIVSQEVSVQLAKLLQQDNLKYDVAFEEELVETEAKRKERREFNEKHKIRVQEPIRVITLHNTEHNKLHLVTFLNTKNEFICSVVMPYGQTLKIVNEYGELREEYSIRQNTAIVLNERVLIEAGKELERYDFEYRQMNKTVFVKLQPLTK